MESNPNLWWIYALLAALFGALSTIFAKIGLQNIDANLATAVRTVVILIIAWGLVLAESKIGQLTRISSRTLVFIIGSGTATGLSWLFYFKALQLGATARVAPIDKASVIIVLIFSAIFLPEPLTISTILGGCLIAIGTLVLVVF
jgi:bacterial/archaeal transporter family protein